MKLANFISPDTLELLTKFNAASIRAQKHAFNNVEYCATRGCTNQKIQWCHAVSEAAQLAGISEKNKVCWIPGKADKNLTFKPFWEEVSTKSALVFKGFCNSCDNSIFKKLDTSTAPDFEVLALLAYRAACYWNWRALVDLKYQETFPKILQDMSEMDAGKLPPLKNNGDEVHGPLIASAAYHQNMVERLMQYTQNAVTAAKYTQIKSHIFDLKKSLPLRFSLAAAFSTNLRNAHQFVSTKECPPIPGLFFHLLDFKGHQKLILSWPKYVPEKHPKLWVKQIQEWSDSGNLGDILMRYFFLNNHGLVFSPKMPFDWDHEKVFFLSEQLAEQNYFGRKPRKTPLFKEPLFKGFTVI